jgi:hypothetical protein
MFKASMRLHENERILALAQLFQFGTAPASMEQSVAPSGARKSAFASLLRSNIAQVERG